MGRTSKRAILFALLSTIFVTAGQFLWKIGSHGTDLLAYLNVPFLAGTASYGLAMILFLRALRDGELSVVYPIMASSFVWIILNSPFVGEVVSSHQWIGVITILFGVSLIGYGSDIRD
ncbi:MAG: hypothetical protein CMH61_01570 [Nanoarchaeota archaeon]|nr:hypothetical protein [Nanoarchaeota archaeon]